MIFFFPKGLCYSFHKRYAPCFSTAVKKKKKERKNVKKEKMFSLGQLKMTYVDNVLLGYYVMCSETCLHSELPEAEATS